MHSLLAAEYTTSYSTSTSGALDPAVTLFILALYLVVFIGVIAGMWKVFTKAGKPGWAAIVPFYNTYTMLEIAGRPGWWLLLFFVPGVQLIIAILIGIDIAKSFGKSAAFGVFGLGIFSFVGYPMLGFGKATYQGANPTNLSATTAAPVAAPVVAAPPTPPTPPTTPPAA
jgi:uncharacterized membrane protein YhaH (DUF805 family)